MSQATALPAPGLLHGPYPQRDPARADPLARLARHWRGHLPARRRYARFADAVLAEAAAWRRLSPEALRAELAGPRARLARDGLSDITLRPVLAACHAAITHALGLRPYATQVMAARILLDGRLAEMHTGEGKTLAIALAALAAALAGIPVHVITANDYLVARDAGQLAGIAGPLGLRVGAVTAGLDRAARRGAYACDVCFCTARELVFDYLRDRQAGGPAPGDGARPWPAPAREEGPVLRGLCLALIDEADSILLDEATTPLILSRPGRPPLHEAQLRLALRLARRLDDGLHYRRRGPRHFELTAPGRDAVRQATRELGGLWASRRFREGLVAQALAALHGYHRDRDYLVGEDGVVIIDPTTGRRADGRQWSQGLHQLIELKEGLPPSAAFAPVAQITYQRFFPRYLQLGGTSATLREARGELLRSYGLPVVPVPRHRPARRHDAPPRLLPDQRAKWDAVVARVAALHAEGRPVLVGTGSVADSARLSARLRAAGLPYAVLDARHHAAEARVVARAGRAGAITVATHMAGRGTDIPLGPGVAALGGLHVINAQLASSPRIDRQLLGRAARQGDPGSSETLLARDEPLLVHTLPGWLRWRLPARPAIRLAQWREEARQRRQRARLARQDRHAARLLAISGPPE